MSYFKRAEIVGQLNVLSGHPAALENRVKVNEYYLAAVIAAEVDLCPHSEYSTTAFESGASAVISTVNEFYPIDSNAVYQQALEFYALRWKIATGKGNEFQQILTASDCLPITAPYMDVYKTECYQPLLGVITNIVKELLAE